MGVIHLQYPRAFRGFIGTGRQIRLRLWSGTANGDAWLDYEALRVTYTAPLPSGSYWRPGLVNSWQIQYSGTIDTSLDVQVYNLDGFDTPKATIDVLHARHQGDVLFQRRFVGELETRPEQIPCVCEGQDPLRLA